MHYDYWESMLKLLIDLNELFWIRLRFFAPDSSVWISLISNRANPLNIFVLLLSLLLLMDGSKILRVSNIRQVLIFDWDRFVPDYVYLDDTGEWRHRSVVTKAKDRRWLGHISYSSGLSISSDNDSLLSDTIWWASFRQLQLYFWAAPRLAPGPGPVPGTGPWALGFNSDLL